MQSKRTPEVHADPARQAPHDDSTSLCPELTSRHPEIKERLDAIRHYRKASERMTQLQSAKVVGQGLSVPIEWIRLQESGRPANLAKCSMRPHSMKPRQKHESVVEVLDRGKADTPEVPLATNLQVCVMNAVDKATRHAWTLLCIANNSTNTAKLLGMFCADLHPERIETDEGSEFRGRFEARRLKLCIIPHILSPDLSGLKDMWRALTLLSSMSSPTSGLSAATFMNRASIEEVHIRVKNIRQHKLLNK